eukprot:scaffold228345_cov18-Tisochrysis_lutea.AAC.1
MQYHWADASAEFKLANGDTYEIDDGKGGTTPYKITDGVTLKELRENPSPFTKSSSDDDHWPITGTSIWCVLVPCWQAAIMCSEKILASSIICTF